MFQQKTASAIIVGIFLISFAAAPAHALTIARDGSATAVIVTHPDAPEPVQHAADELATFLNQITAATFKRAKTASDSTANLLVGPQAAKFADPTFSTEDLGSDGIVIKTIDNNLILAGGHPRGTLYAVYTFLEDHLGCHWWTSTESTIPKTTTINIETIDTRYVPPLEYREPFWYDAFDGDWAVRNKSNGSSERLDVKRGGKHSYQGFVHTFYSLIPPAKYFKDHPEWFSQIEGQRKHEHTQLCLTNDAMRNELIKNLKANLRKNPTATIASVSQNDWHGNCQCEKCAAIDAEEGSPAGSLLRFVNAVAAEIEPEFPNVAISTLAYQYTRKPPKITKPRSNVIVRLCSIECSFSHPLTHPRNQKFRDDIVGWSKICNRLYIWDYTTNFRHFLLPHPNLRVLAPNIKFFTENGARGIFEQGAYTTNGAEMAELRAWVLAKLLWNPNLDGQTLIDQFLDGYYSPPAAKHIRAYINLIHDEVEKTDDRLGCFAGIAASKVNVGWQGNASKFINFKTLNKSLAYLKDAQREVAQDPDLTFRVQCATLPVQYAFMMCWNSMRQKAAESNSDWPMPDSIDTAY
ncbi:MAG: DUF4838 domain-containing protein, partial [Sedimentisphaerales bacterium]|nr:DUF4838 domain-containing protein [Sedimentisphaerales bacterium]